MTKLGKVSITIVNDTGNETKETYRQDYGCEIGLIVTTLVIAIPQ